MYEVPAKLKNLYQHWPFHTRPSQTGLRPIVDRSILHKINVFIAERMHTWYRRSIKEFPYSQDPIIAQYRFCNIYRELDRQTIDIHSILFDLRSDFNLWLLNLAFCRFIGNPSTVVKVGLLNFDKNNNLQVYKKLFYLARPKFGSAYVFPISAIQKSAYQTREEFFCFYLPQVVPKVARFIQTQKRVPVADVINQITDLFGFNFKFHWTEILIDVAYQYPGYIDLYGRFPIGPGSEPTMKLLNSKITAEEVTVSLVDYQPEFFPYLTFKGSPLFLSAENWEGIGCEFRKYTALKNGQGRKRKYLQTASTPAL